MKSISASKQNRNRKLARAARKQTKQHVSSKSKNKMPHRNKKKIKLSEEEKRRRKKESQEKRTTDFKKRQAEKEKLRALKLKHKNRQELAGTINSFFSSIDFESINKKTRLVKRVNAKINAQQYAYIISLSNIEHSKKGATLDDMTSLVKSAFDIEISNEALNKRIRSKVSVNFLRNSFIYLLNEKLKKIPKMQSLGELEIFSGVIINDSSQANLYKKLAKFMKGSGGAASPSAVKLQIAYDILNHSVTQADVKEGVYPDQKFMNSLVKSVNKCQLIISDLGFFVISKLREIDVVKKAYYISRLSIKTNIYLSIDAEEPVDKIELFELLTKKGKVNSASQIVYIGKEKLKTRLVLQKVPSRVWKIRQKKFKTNRKKEPSEEFVEWSRYSVFITNIPEDMCSNDIILSIYKIRWQIELIFKIFKSNLKFHILRSKTNENRVLSLIYGKLIAFVFMSTIFTFASACSGDREISIQKLTDWLFRENCLKWAILEGNIEALLYKLLDDLKKICLQDRSRKNTLRMIEEAFFQEEEYKKIAA